MSDSHTNENSLKILCCVSKKHKSLTHDREKQYILQKKKKCRCPKLTSKQGDEENKPVGQLITLELVLTQDILMGPPAHTKKKIIKHPTNPRVEKYKLQNLQIFLSFTTSPHIPKTRNRITKQPLHLTLFLKCLNAMKLF
jgi:hypothetical protein